MAIYVQISNDRLAPPQVEDPRPTEQLPQGKPINQRHSNATPHPTSISYTDLIETDPEKPPDPHVEPHWQVVVPSADVQRPTFHCNVCLETYAVDDIARVDLCEHAFCRECLRNYISSKLKDRHFPIFCPTCMTEESTQDHSGGLAHPSVYQNDFLPDSQLLTSFLLNKLESPRRSARSGPT